jgi:hypothetical protein
MLFLESVFIVIKITGNRVLTAQGLKVENGRLFSAARITNPRQRWGLFLESVFIVIKITGNRVLTAQGLKVENGRLFSAARITNPRQRWGIKHAGQWHLRLFGNIAFKT